MRTANDYRKTYPNKTDDQIIESLGNEVRDKVETIHRLLKEEDDKHKGGLLLAMEFGYKQCEKGNNLEMAFVEFGKLTK